MLCKPAPDRPELTALVKRSMAQYNTMSEGEKDQLHRVQTASYVRGEMGMQDTVVGRVE
jgi:hypothetical protein